MDTTAFKKAAALSDLYQAEIDKLFTGVKECGNCGIQLQPDNISKMVDKPEEFCSQGCAKAYYPNTQKPRPTYTLTPNSVVFG